MLLMQYDTPLLPRLGGGVQIGTEEGKGTRENRHWLPLNLTQVMI